MFISVFSNLFLNATQNYTEKILTHTKTKKWKLKQWLRCADNVLPPNKFKMKKYNLMLRKFIGVGYIMELP